MSQPPIPPAMTKDEALRQKLAYEAPSAGAERHPRGYFPTTRRGATQEKICDICAGRQQDQHCRAEQQQEPGQGHPAEPRVDLARALDMKPAVLVAVGERHVQRTRDDVELPARRARVHARPESSDRAQPMPTPVLRDRPHTGLDFVQHRERNPEVGNDPGLGAGEPRPCDADNRCRPIVDRNRSAENAGVSAETRLPEMMSENDDRRLAGCVVAIGVEAPAEDECRPRDREEVRGDQRAPHPFEVTVQSNGCRESGIDRRDALERACGAQDLESRDRTRRCRPRPSDDPPPRCS